MSDLDTEKELTKEEALGVLEGYAVYGCGVCLQDGIDFYQTENGLETLFLDAEKALIMAVNALKTEAIPVEFIKTYMQRFTPITQMAFKGMINEWRKEE